MKDYIKNLIQKEGLRLALLFMIVVICLNVILVIYYRSVIDKNSETIRQVQVVKEELHEMEHYINMADMAVRGYITQKSEPLLDPYVEARDNYHSNLKSLEKNIQGLNYDMNKLKPASSAIITYMNSVKLMIDLCKTGRLDDAITLLEENGNQTVRLRTKPFIHGLNGFLNDVSKESKESFKKSMNSILIIQIILILFALPTLILAYRNAIKDGRFKGKIFKLINDSNKNYLFDDGLDTALQNEDSVTESLVSNLKKAVGFINHITRGEYNIEWEGMDQKNRQLNKNNIAGELLMMRDQMIKVKKEDEIRIWTNEGLSKFADLIRNHQNDLNLLSDCLISDIVVYLGAQQGGLFFVSEDEHKKKYLELMGCYAYERKKFREKRIEIGQGMVGQCFLEGQTTYITNLPQEYVSITSGLGDINPNILLIVPLKINEEVVGVIEIACLKEIAPYKIEFMERLAETIASSIASVKTNEQTRILLEQSQQQAEEMRAQEEEMRQNMEELQATQEQMHRKNEEVEELLKEASTKEEAVKQQNMLMLEEKKTLEVEDAILTTLMKLIPDRVTIKDDEGRYLKVSTSKYKSLREKGIENIIGQSDKEIFGLEHFTKSFAIEKEIMQSQKPMLGQEEKIEISKGETIWGSTSRVALENKNGQVLGTVVLTRDITEMKKLTDELEQLKRELFQNK